MCGSNLGKLSWVEEAAHRSRLAISHVGPWCVVVVVCLVGMTHAQHSGARARAGAHTHTLAHITGDALASCGALNPRAWTSRRGAARRPREPICRGRGAGVGKRARRGRGRARPRGAPRRGHARGGGGGSCERDGEAWGVAPAARARSARSAQLGDDEDDHAARSASRGQEPTPSPLSTREAEDRDEPAAQGRPGWRIETSLRRKRRPGWRIETSLRRASVPAARGSGGCRRSL